VNTPYQPSLSFRNFDSPLSPMPLVQESGRSMPYTLEPGRYEPGKLWLYGNVKLLHGELAVVESSFISPPYTEHELMLIEQEAERLVLSGKILVTGIHNPAHQRAALVPLRWGAPRIVVFSGGFYHHLGASLRTEPFRVARLWRYEWDSTTDLAVSRREPSKLPTFAHHNPSVDNLIRGIAEFSLPGFSSPLSTMRKLATS
jgi:hypothetical protein